LSSVHGSITVTAMDSDGQRWTTLDNAGQQWTLNSGQHNSGH
jgi:hypothetical protein